MYRTKMGPGVHETRKGLAPRSRTVPTGHAGSKPHPLHLPLKGEDRTIEDCN